ncbi:MAG: hypothetical protein M1831_005393 [Alyxoria varia]|nr:MAG: hypothetical protein M1831_005393 [Alyxoria varia]
MRGFGILAVSCMTWVTASAKRSGKYDFGNIPPSQILYGSHYNSMNTSHALAERSLPETLLEERDTACTHGPNTRSCWTSGMSIATDFDRKWPTTGQTKSYQLTITNTTCNPDGTHERICLLFNNQYPGPTIRANWGDTIQVTVKNEVQENGTSTHWHGLRQLNTNDQDGVNGLTECPLAPGKTQSYTFQATQFGTTWYHSHYSSQYGEGLVGPIVIDGPASANYDYDLGPLPVSDWFYATAFQLNCTSPPFLPFPPARKPITLNPLTFAHRADISNVSLQAGSPPPPPDTLLVNGTNKAGSLASPTVQPKKKYRLRLINTSVDAAIRVSIDNHKLLVMTADFIPVKPITVDSVMLAVGQRYDVVVSTDQPVGNYWIRAAPESSCASGAKSEGRGILHYDGAPDGDPKTTSTATSRGCSVPGTLTPYVPNTVGNEAEFKSQAKNLDVNLQLPGTTSNNQNIVVWGVNLTAIDIQWDTPTLSYVKNGNTDYPTVANVIEVTDENEWVYWIIQEVQGGPVQIPHPIHLHGHDFYVMGTGSGTFDLENDPAKLTYKNPTRRDTETLPAAGWLVIAFPTDNPGAWLMHCHIAWHISQGLGVQFLEAKSQIKLPGAQYEQQCDDWKDYYRTALYKQDDSGL